MFPPQGLGYDRAITIFSPDGRLFQVEYAIEAVRKGTTAIGICASDGVALVVEKRVLPLQDSTTIEKIFKLDDHVGAAISGLTADARVLIDHARIQAQINRLTYDEPIDTQALTKKIADLLQMYCQHAGVRPFGVSLLIAGVDSDGLPRLFMTDPSGAYWGYLSQAIGQNAETVREKLEKEYKKGLSLDEAILLALSALKEVIESNLEAKNVEIAWIKTDDKQYRELEPEELQKYIDRLT
ncbi:MAG: archaeal proteasome endopeptidase complex subunit alpha [Candidatus Helarchaeota archaeon]